MRVNFSTSGVDDLQKRLADLPHALSRKVQIDALKAGAEPIRDAAAALAPRDANANAPHLADNIIVAVAKQSVMDAEGLFDQTGVEVGPTQAHFYGFFQEVGTAFQPAQPFMRPAFDENVRRALNIVRSAAWASIRKRLGLGGSRSTTSGGL